MIRSVHSNPATCPQALIYPHPISSVYPPHYDIVLAICPATILTLEPVMLQGVGGPRCEPSEWLVVDSESCYFLIQTIFLVIDIIVVAESNRSLGARLKQLIVAQTFLGVIQTQLKNDMW